MYTVGLCLPPPSLISLKFPSPTCHPVSYVLLMYPAWQRSFEYEPEQTVPLAKQHCTQLRSVFDDLNPMSSYTVDKHTETPNPASCRRQQRSPPEKDAALPGFGKRQFAVYISVELSRCRFGSQTREHVCAHMHSHPGFASPCCQEIKLS